MPSLPKLSTAGALFLLTTLLHECGVLGASLRGPKLRGGEPEGGSNSPYLVPSADMVKALEYIERLRQQTRGDQGAALDYDDLSRLRTLLPLAAATAKQDETAPDETADWSDEERSQQWLRAMLRTLQRAGKEPKAAASLPSSRYALSNRQRPEEEEEQVDEDDDGQLGDGGDYEGGPWPEPGKLPKKKYPLMFEDEDSRESPYKRTNENVEEQYTPQSLATLQSVFEELGKLSAPKSHKRHSLAEEQRIYRGDSDDIYRANNMAYEDVTGGEDWTPVEEKVETEEEVKGSREEIDRGSEESNGNSAKRSSSPAKYEDKEEPDDFTKLVDYYLLKILEKSEQTEHKRDRVEELSADKRVAPAAYDLNPQAIYQLIDISRKLQIPPEDLIDMLKNGEIKTQDKLLEAEEEAELPDDLERAEEKLTQISSYNKDKNPSKFFNRKLPEMQAGDLPGDLNTEDILNILGLESQGSQKAKHLLKQKQSKNTLSRYYAPSGRRADFIISEPGVSEKRKSEDEDAVDEDELASYLAAKMLAQYPKVLKKMDLKRTSQPSSKEQQLAFETLMQDYFDQVASDKNPPSRRMSEVERTGDSAQAQHQEDDALLKMLGYLNPETGENEERDLYAKTVAGM